MSSDGCGERVRRRLNLGCLSLLSLLVLLRLNGKGALTLTILLMISVR